MEIKIYATLRDVVGAARLQLGSDSEITVDSLLQELCVRYPAVRPKLLRHGELHPATHILINGRDMRFLNGLETVVSPEDEVRIFPPVGGGA